MAIFGFGEKKSLIERRKEMNEKFKRDAALAYNRAHCYSSFSPKWMCPLCNEIQRSFKQSPFTGPHYKECCGLPEGDRYHEKFAARTDNLIEKVCK